MAVSVDWQHLRMTLVQPHRGRGSGRGQVHGDARRAELVDHVVKPLERELALARFDLVPAEDGEGHSVDASLGHQVDVLVQRLLRPLIRIVVTAERDATTIRRQQRRPTECSASSHINQVLYCIGLWPVLCLPVLGFAPQSHCVRQLSSEKGDKTPFLQLPSLRGAICEAD